MTEQILRDRLKAEGLLDSQANLQGATAATEERANKAYYGDVGGAIGGMLAKTPERPSIRERLGRKIAQHEATKSSARRARELDALLSKHPDIARILDLYEELRY